MLLRANQLLDETVIRSFQDVILVALEVLEVLENNGKHNGNDSLVGKLHLEPLLIQMLHNQALL